MRPDLPRAWVAKKFEQKDRRIRELEELCARQAREIEALAATLNYDIRRNGT